MHFAQIICYIIRVRDYKDKREKGKELKNARKRPSIRGEALNGAFNPNRFCPLGQVMTALPYFFHSPNDTAPAVRWERITSMPTDIHKADGVRQLTKKEQAFRIFRPFVFALFRRYIFCKFLFSLFTLEGSSVTLTPIIEGFCK